MSLILSQSEGPEAQSPSRNESSGSRVSISIVIPAYNEGQRLPRTLARIRDYLRARVESPNAGKHGADITEIIVVDDGSRDNTSDVVASWQTALPGLRLISNDINRGKGFSVRHGMLEAKGSIALFTDADLSAPIEELDKLLAALDTADIAIGSRAMDRTLIETHQSKLREFGGIVFNKLVRLIAGIDFCDTQCGFKAFVLARTRMIFEQQRVTRFGFDPEILFLAKRLGLRCTEVPVRWANDPATKVHFLRDSTRMFLDLVAMRWHAWTGKYKGSGAGNLD